MSIPNVSEILIAWHRARNPTQEQKELAEHRAKFCDVCEFKEFKAIIRSYTCNACGCPLSKKVYSPRGKDACPKNKWDR